MSLPLRPQDALETQSAPAGQQETSYVPLGPSDGAQDNHGAAAPLAGQARQTAACHTVRSF